MDDGCFTAPQPLQGGWIPTASQGHAHVHLDRLNAVTVSAVSFGRGFGVLRRRTQDTVRSDATEASALSGRENIYSQVLFWMEKMDLLP